MLIAAEAHCKKYGSRATDADKNALRAAQYLLTNTVNRVVSAMEVSDQQAALTALGHPADLSSTHFWTCSMGAALTHVMGQQEHEEEDPGDDELDQQQDDPAPPMVADFIDALEFDAAELGEVDIAARAEIYGAPGEEPKSVPQHVHYAMRGSELLLLSLYDYCRIISIKPKVKQQEQQQEQQNPAPRRAAGRRANKTLEFAAEHPLHASHVQCLRSKHCTVILQPPPPRMPEHPIGCTGSKAKAAAKAAAYFLTLFQPWTAEQVPVTSYANWAEYCNDLTTNPTALNRHRLAVMTRMSQGMAISTETKEAAHAWRFRAAKMWKSKGRDGSENPPGQYPGQDAPILSAQEMQLSAQAAAALETLQRLVSASPKARAQLQEYQKNASRVQKIMSATTQILPSRARDPSIAHPSGATSEQVAAAVAAAGQTLSFLKSPLQSDPLVVGSDAAAPGPAAPPLLLPPAWPCTAALSQSQLTAALKIRVRLPAGSLSPNPFFVMGGPGCGKSFLISHLRLICQSLSVGIRTAAPAAVAAVPIRKHPLQRTLAKSRQFALHRGADATLVGRASRRAER